ncbi:hydroxypyruvate isomerase family protein [Antarcticimicrobium luteum]|uniref:Hydroxypyruvate isomerase n=1 Tax=Antarcticimicrobium luteum TaxID=2547397 RepID=A0A4R5V4K8_9RHOB|nr:TIM barrel protein [Antarcticimicrobium luteum]TDK46853.1 hydroxypyruvate isomerase [Antarcticimicrobium luteum]
MPRFAANISLLFTELPFMARFAAAARAGFDGVEILYPYDHPAEEIRSALDANGLALALFNAPPPGPGAAYPALPDGEDAFRATMEQVLTRAQILRPDAIHVMAGYSGDPRAEDSFTANLQWLADRAPEQGFTIEPLNLGDQPGYVLADYDLAARILARVDRPNLGLQYDSYHADRIHGDALATWHRHVALVRHIQLGAPPDRSEPRLDRGPVDFPALLMVIETSGYDGWISAEYNPSTERTEDSLGWMAG